jgi:type IV secretion system protein VirB3
VNLRRLPFHRVLHRPTFFLGGERELALMTLIIAGGLAVSGINLVSFVVVGICGSARSRYSAGWQSRIRR